jgi:nucleoside-diphosphate-sugar epimerase
MNILVTGAAGFIGSHLAVRLAEEGHRVLGVDSFNGYYDPAIKHANVDEVEAAGAEVQRLDLAADPLTEMMRGVDIVFHAAAQPGISATTSFETYLRNNVVATQRLLEAARRSDSIELFVNVSTSSVYGADASGSETTEPRPTSTYGVTKLAAEQLVMAAARDADFPGCSFRLFSVYGPRERPDKLIPILIRSLLERRPLPLFEGSEHHRRSYTYVEDIIDGLVSVLGQPAACHGQLFNLGNNQDISTGEIIRLTEEIVGREVEVEHKPRRAGDQLRTQADTGKASAILGYTPRVEPREGLRRTVAWFTKRHVSEAVS